ncbi:DUF4389 domain-containing protein [Halochromatium roseum]|uniref:DUF4389 domain-containing protein n=1 Tax=Halochromatium roseum TaxID=391920 RepID=UPI00191458EA|nr:DUF4389 domain-containing protein [Halochromatium roseum]MBK5938380.1 hypothetical protein [Halochromatium roseum]
MHPQDDQIPIAHEPLDASTVTTEARGDGWPHFADHPNLLIRIGLTLLQAVFMLLYALLFEVLNYSIFAIAILQYLSIIATGRPISMLRRFNEYLSAYMGDVAGYLTCVDPRPPFPFSRPREARGMPYAPRWRRDEK